MSKTTVGNMWKYTVYANTILILCTFFHSSVQSQNDLLRGEQQ